MSTPTTNDDTPVVRRRAKGRAEDSRRVTFLAPRETADAAVRACHERGVSLSSELTRALEALAARDHAAP